MSQNKQSVNLQERKPLLSFNTIPGQQKNPLELSGFWLHPDN
ncbi:hypothetical protein ARMA_2648 [Ardenticatena maritima]|uniref:Uncharacterized protein n=1 Tax=Ardenticatena maritima TaxID=872965 RepID=A0A0M8K912_9CHLR|nr:hypothetical protein ARMA_2648 [Ardenticatena maritima]